VSAGGQRKVALPADYESDTEAKVRVKLSGQIRLSDIHIARLLMQVKPEMGRAVSPASEKARNAAMARWNALGRSALSGPAPKVGAISRMCKGHHGMDISERNVSRVQGGVDVLGNLVIRPTPHDVVADEAPSRGEGVVVVRRPSEAGGAQLSEVGVISGIGSRNRSASNQGSASHNGDGQDGQPAR
jgi:hypothetical protein